MMGALVVMLISGGILNGLTPNLGDVKRGHQWYLEVSLNPTIGTYRSVITPVLGLGSVPWSHLYMICICMLLAFEISKSHRNHPSCQVQFIISMGYGRWALEALLIASVLPTRQAEVRRMFIFPTTLSMIHSRHMILDIPTIPTPT